MSMKRSGEQLELGDISSHCEGVETQSRQCGASPSGSSIIQNDGRSYFFLTVTHTVDLVENGDGGVAR